MGGYLSAEDDPSPHAPDQPKSTSSSAQGPQAADEEVRNEAESTSSSAQDEEECELPPKKCSFQVVSRNSKDHSSSYYAGSGKGAEEGAIHCKGFQTRQDLTLAARGLLIATVGLPGRGKSFIARKLEGFLKWQCMNTRTFNAGKYRREAEGASQSGRADFFDTKNAAAAAARQNAAMRALDDAMAFLESDGDVAIFDATNSTDERRESIANRVKEAGTNYRVLFLEVICDDPEVLDTNFRNKVKHSPDFGGLSMEEALLDLALRVKKYEEAYETISDDSLSYIKLYNMSSKVLVNRIYGSVSKSIMPYLMGIHIGTRPIWLVRAGEVPPGEKKDANLTQNGRIFAANLADFVSERTMEFYGGTPSEKPVRVLSSTSVSAVQTVLATLQESSDVLSLHFKQTSALNPIDRGRLDGPWWIDLCTDLPPFAELEARDPGFHSRWESNRLRTRFPGGESYYDVMTRAESVLLEIEMSTRPVLVVSHITCIQVLLAYFEGTPLEEAWSTPVLEHGVIQVIPTLGGGYRIETLKMSEEAASTTASESSYRSKLPGLAELDTTRTVHVADFSRSTRRAMSLAAVDMGTGEDPCTPHNLDRHGDGRW